MSELSKIPADVLISGILSELGRNTARNLIESSPTLNKEYEDNNLYWLRRFKRKFIKNSSNELKSLNNYNINWKSAYFIVESEGFKGLLIPEEDNVDYINLALDIGVTLEECEEYEEDSVEDDSIGELECERTNIIKKIANMRFINIFEYILRRIEFLLIDSEYRKLIDHITNSDNLDAIKAMIKIPKLRSEYLSDMFVQAAGNGSLNIVKFLLQYISNSDPIKDTIIRASNNGNSRIAYYLLDNTILSTEQYNSILKSIHESNLIRKLLKYPGVNPLMVTHASTWADYIHEYYNFDVSNIDIPIEEYALSEESYKPKGRYRDTRVSLNKGKIYGYAYLIINSANKILKQYKRDLNSYMTGYTADYEKPRKELGELLLLAINEYRNYPAFVYLINNCAPITYKSVLYDAVAKWQMYALELISSERLTYYMMDENRAINLINAVTGEIYNGGEIYSDDYYTEEELDAEEVSQIIDIIEYILVNDVRENKGTYQVYKYLKNKMRPYPSISKVIDYYMNDEELV